MSERDDGQLSFFSGRQPASSDIAREPRRVEPGAPAAAPVELADACASPRPAPLTIELKRGSTRRRHVEGVLRGDTLVVSYPARMARADAEQIALELRERMQRRLARERVDLRSRARNLARDLDLPMPAIVEWSDRQLHRWGSCTPGERHIRVSSRLAGFPDWVLDYVLVHELAHLRHADHSPEFHALVARYPLAERAIGFLTAISIYANDEARSA